MTFEIPMTDSGGWGCTVCGRFVSGKDGKPSSHYWNLERQEVYCGAVDSLDRHEEIAKLTGENHDTPQT
jgi:hypothetical protein